MFYFSQLKIRGLLIIDILLIILFSIYTITKLISKIDL